MTNHSPLLITFETKNGISKVMQSLGRRNIQHVNKSYGYRNAMKWAHSANLVDTESYLLFCYRYIEPNPVPAGMVSQPVKYPFSSFPVNVNGDESLLITPRPFFLAMGRDERIRHARYADLFEMKLEKGVFK